MDIWIIQDGEKTGPIHDFEIRHRIDTGELGPDTPAWHEGLSAWMPLGELALFENEFRTDSEEAPREESTAAPSSPPPLPASPQMARRCLARWLDLNLYSALYWLGIWASGRDLIEVMMDPLVVAPRYIPWFALESVLIHKFGTTPGKWLLGIRITNEDGSLLSLKDAIWRSVKVFLFGIGMGWDFMPLICIALTLHFTRKLGRPLWDHSGAHVAVISPIRGGRLAAWILLFLASVAIHIAVLAPPRFRDLMKNDPVFRENWNRATENLRKNAKP